MFGFALQAQTPYPTPYQTIGGTSPKTAGKVKGGIFIDSTLVIPHYDDTLSATLGVTSLYNSLIQVGDQNVYYKRVGNKWVSIEGEQGCPQGIIYGSATWSSFDLIYNVTNCQYAINCIIYSSAATNITLSPADPSYPRIDVIYVDTNSVAGVLTGTPSSAPIKPTIDPLSQLELTYVYVPAGGTTPLPDSATIVYDENVEWGGSSDISGANFAYTINPYTGIYSTYLPSPSFSGGEVNYTDTITHQLGDYQYLKFWVRINGAYAAEGGNYFSVVFMNGSVRVSPTYFITELTYGFDPAILNEWQLITIPVPTDIDPAFNRVRIEIFNHPNSCQIDRVFLLSNAAPPPATGNYWAFTPVSNPSGNKVIGTADSTGFKIYTNNQLRVSVPADGIKEDATNNVKMLMWNPTTKDLYWRTLDSIGVLGCLKLYDSAGVKWIRDTCGGSGGSGWLLTGNAGTTPGTNFLGTTDNQDLVIKRNNTEAGRLGNSATSFGTSSSAGTSGTSYGALSGYSSSSYTSNTFIGYASGASSTGIANTFLGYGSGYQSTADSSVSIGVFGSTNNFSARSSVHIGCLAGQSNSGNSSIAIGRRAAITNTYNSVIALGTNATPTAAYQFCLSDSITHLYIPGYLSATDTTDWKPMVFNPTTKVAQYLDHWPRATTTPGLNDVLGVGSVAYHNIFLRGSKSFSTMSDGLGFGEATLYHTEGTGGQLYLTRSSGYGANLMPVSGATTVSTNYLPDTTGIYTMYVNGVAPNSKGKLNLYNFPDSIVTPVIKSKGGASLQVKVGSNTPLTFNTDGTITAGGNFSSPYTFEGFTLKANGLVQTPSSGYFDFNSRSKVYSPADGQILLRNNAGSDFGLLQFGGTTSSYPALKRSGTKIQIRLADDSNFGTVEASNIRSGTGSPESAITAPVGTIYARTDGDTTDAAYLKTSGTGNTGWERMGVKKFKEYVAIINQSSTSDPTATVINNELGGTVTFTYRVIGGYTAELTGAFTTNKTIVSITSGNSSASASLFGYSSDPDTIKFGSYDSSGTPTDGLINNATLIIRVYY